MKKIWFATALFATLAIVHNAAAFSVDQSSSQNSDGTPKFADPDDQKPGFMLGLDGGETRVGSIPLGAPTVTAPTMGENDNGARAFDQAFAHQQDKY